MVWEQDAGQRRGRFPGEGGGWQQGDGALGAPARHGLPAGHHRGGLKVTGQGEPEPACSSFGGTCGEVYRDLAVLEPCAD